ncbi:hypothetical protein KFE25_001884 [Diacronema lutheri]|uniref:RBR-type E3 ubiquitin transferase n=3 Tax=Diacronema lutheri TaxID=2081491 RepID=A0A8J5XFH2_DIALT|nr:hypothetical protein KFE25_001884 [Diacronema lutheri]
MDEVEALRCMYGDELRELALDGGARELEIDVPISLDAPIDVTCGARRASVRHLSLTLRIRLPDGYPATAPPHFALISCWLEPSQHAHLLAVLTTEWEGMHDGVLICWVERLRADAASGLGEVVLAERASAEGGVDECERPKERAPSGQVERARAGWASAHVAPVEGGVIVREPHGAFEALLAEDARRVDEVDGARQVRCAICLDDVLRRACPALAGCAHSFCRGCLRAALEARIRQRGALALGCPECAVQLLPTEVSALVEPELYALHERQTLLASLAGMDDMTWCPLAHCQAAVVLERDADGALDKLGRCAQCGFCFCTLCQRSWHGDGPCSDFKRRWDAADAAERAALETRFGRHAIEEIESTHLISSTTQGCPCCRAPIEKNGGCHHMRCASCAHEWCWLCRGKYSATHFTTSGAGCRQFGPDFFAEVARALREERPSGNVS